MIKQLKKYWGVVIAIGLFWLTIGVLYILSIGQNQDTFVYALDDPYIHMSMAKNFVQHGILGVSKDQFTSSTSSPLWTFLIAFIYFLVGVNTISPLLLNCFFGSALIFAVYQILNHHTSNSFYVFSVLLSIIFLTPLPSLVFTGQEHILHALLTILFVYSAVILLSDTTIRSKHFYFLLFLAPLVTFTRYEALPLIIIVGALLIVKGKYVHASSLIGLGILPIIAYGIFSLTNGWYFFPNSILLKSNLSEVISFKDLLTVITHAKYQQVFRSTHLLFLMIAGLFVYILYQKNQTEIWNTARLLILIFIPTTLIHLLFAQTGGFYRYESYLVALGILTIAIGILTITPNIFFLQQEKKTISKMIGMVLLSILFILPFSQRAITSLHDTPQATTNIYEQQVQMGLFIKKFYEENAIAINDIGAVNYLADIQCFDIWGLANMEIARLKRNGMYHTRHLDGIAKQRNVKIAIIYDHWLSNFGGIPSQWIKAGAWSITNNIVCGGNTVSFYAIDSTIESDLTKNLRLFSDQLPKNVLQTGKYKNN